MSQTASVASSRPATQSELASSPSHTSHPLLDHFRPSSSSSSSFSTDSDDDDSKEPLSPLASHGPGTIALQVNGRRRHSIIEYVQREDDEQEGNDVPNAVEQGIQAVLNQAMAGEEEERWSDDEVDDHQPGNAAKADPFFTDLEKQHRHRQALREEKEEEEERADLAPVREAEAAVAQSGELPSQRRVSLTSGPAPSLPSRSPSSHSTSRPVLRTSQAPSPSTSRRASHLTPGPTEMRTLSRSGSAITTTSSPSKRSRTHSARPLPSPHQSSPSPHTTTLPPVLLFDGLSRGRLERRIGEVRRGIEEVEATLRLKMEREKERERERAQRDSMHSSSALLLRPPSSLRARPIREGREAESEEPSPAAVPPVDESKALVLRVEEKEEGPYAGLLSNLSFSNTLLPLTEEELAMTALPFTPPASPPLPPSSHSLIPLLPHPHPHPHLLPPPSPPPLHYHSCFPSWLSTRSDFTSFISQTQLLCLHVAEKEADKRSAKDLQKLGGFLAGFAFFARFTQHTLGELSRTCWLERRKRGERVDSQAEEGSVMRFLYEGRVSYETSIARLFKRKRREQEREEARRRDEKRAEAAAGRRATSALRALSRKGGGRGHERTASGLITPAGGPSRGRTAASLAGAQPLGTPAAAGVPSSAGVRLRSSTTTTSGPAAAATSPRIRSGTMPAGGGGGVRGSVSGSAVSTPTLGPAQILSNALSYDPLDHHPPTMDLGAAGRPATAFDGFDDLLLSHTLGPGDTFGQSLLFNHFFSSYSFSQIYRLKRQQRLHAQLGKNLHQPRWGWCACSSAR